jgi:spiro-SPASM protein
MALIPLVLSRPGLSLIIETSGLGWKREELEETAALAAAASRKENAHPAALAWIVSLDAASPERYGEIRGPGFSTAVETAKTLLGLFPHDAYVQAIRTVGYEDDIETFYRSWKAAAPGGGTNIIIQKYDDFCGALPKKQASDLSPVKRQPCWHLMRDMPVLIDGTVPVCRECLGPLGSQEPLRFQEPLGSQRPLPDGKGIPADTRQEPGVLGNAFTEDLETIWSRGAPVYGEHCRLSYKGVCAACDEYYTYNF